MIKLKKLVCPSCGANLNEHKGSNITYCEYCGAKVMIDDDSNTTHTINKNVKVEQTYHIRRTDDADVIRAGNEIEKDKQNFKQVLVIWGGLFSIILAIVLFFVIRGCVAQNTGQLNAGYYKDLVGKNYKTVEAHFEAAGFKNIELVDLNDSIFFNDGVVDTISVGGNTTFETIDWFDPDVTVVISYH